MCFTIYFFFFVSSYLSHKDDDSSGLQDVFDRIEEVVLAAQGLQEVTSVMKKLSDIASSNKRTRNFS